MKDIEKIKEDIEKSNFLEENEKILLHFLLISMNNNNDKEYIEWLQKKIENKIG